MSAVKKQARRLERYRARHKGKTVPERVGTGASLAREARKVNIQAELVRKKVTGKAMREFESLGMDELKNALDSARKELFNLRFKLTTGQLENVASIPAARRRVARILTLMKQKEVGA